MPTVDVPAPMAGSVKELIVAVGDSVSAGDELLIIESMKMEIPLESPVAGTIAEILVAAPSTIEEGAVLVRVAV